VETVQATAQIISVFLQTFPLTTCQAASLERAAWFQLNRICER